MHEWILLATNSMESSSDLELRTVILMPKDCIRSDDLNTASRFREREKDESFVQSWRERGVSVLLAAVEISERIKQSPGQCQGLRSLFRALTFPLGITFIFTSHFSDIGRQFDDLGAYPIDKVDDNFSYKGRSHFLKIGLITVEGLVLVVSVVVVVEAVVVVVIVVVVVVVVELG